MLDKRGRLFAMGDNLHGRLGLSDKDLPSCFKFPTQITFGLPKPSYQSKIIHVTSGVSHTVAVTRKGDLYSWGEGSNQRLGLGYIEGSTFTPNQETPHQITNVFDNKSILSIGCGKTMSGLVTQSGTFYVWGKGAHEKPKADDYIQCSTPYALLEQKQVVHLAFGNSHVMAIDRFKQLYGWGEGTLGCLGFGEPRKKMMPVQVPFFEGKKIVDVACGDGFSVIIAEIPRSSLTQQAGQTGAKFDEDHFQKTGDIRTV